MRPSHSLLSLLLFAGFTSAALAATAPSLRIACSGSDNQPTSSVLSFAFDTAIASNAGGGSGGGSSSKPTYSMSLQIPLSTTYDTIYKIATQGKHIPSCILTKPNGSSTVTITMDDVLISEVKLLSGDFFLNGLPGPRVELSLAFASVTEQSIQ